MPFWAVQAISCAGFFTELKLKDDSIQQFMHSPSSATIRVMLANSSQIVLWALEKLIDGERPEMEAIGKATSSADALRLAKEKRPDILLLGLYLGIEKSVDLIPDFVKDEHTRVLIFTEMREPQGTVDRAILNGASGVVYKEEPIQNILKAIEKIHGGELWLNRNTFNRILMKSLRARGGASTSYDIGKTATLTRKERLIVNAFAIEAGSPNKRIAEILCISEQTLRNHLTSIFNKLEIGNRFELFMFAKRHHQPDLTEPSPAFSVSSL